MREADQVWVVPLLSRSPTYRWPQDATDVDHDRADSEIILQLLRDNVRGLLHAACDLAALRWRCGLPTLTTPTSRQETRHNEFILCYEGMRCG